MQKIKKILKEWQKEYMIMDFEHPFLTDSLEEELLLLGITATEQIIEETSSYFRSYKADFSSQQSLLQLSGGEKAILTLILYNAIFKSKQKPVKILLINILESLSAENRMKIISYLKSFSSGISLYNLVNEKPQHLF